MWAELYSKFNCKLGKGLRDIIRSVVPARIVPGFRFIIIFELAVKPYVDYFFDMDKVFDIPLYSNCL